MHTTTLQELAELTEAKLLPGTVPLPETIEGFADLMSATETDVSFYGNAAYLPKVRKTKAAAVFVPHDFDEPMASARLIVENPSVAFAIAVDQLSLPYTSSKQASIQVPRFIPPHKSIPPRSVLMPAQSLQKVFASALGVTSARA